MSQDVDVTNKTDQQPAPRMVSSRVGVRDMTSGVIWRQLVFFSLPMMASVLFQQLYNTVDSLVVGNFVGANALGAVTGSSTVVFALISLFIGLSNGATVVVSQDFGAHDEQGMRRSVHTSILATTLLSIIGAVAGVISAPFMPSILNMDPVLHEDATTYLWIFSLGIPALMLYDVGSSVLRAVGDSRRPLYVVAAGSMANVVLDLIFVWGLDWGVAGAAWATVISEVLGAVVVMIMLSRARGPHRLRMRWLRIDRAKLSKVLSVGIPSGLQMALISLSNVFVNAYINAFGAAVTTGWGIDFRVDGFVMVPIQGLSMSLTTFVGQNYGAHRLDRIRRGIALCRGMTLACVAVMAGLCVAFAPQLAAIFTSDPQAQYHAMVFIRLMAPFDVLAALVNVDQSSLQGMGDAKVPMLISIGTYVVLRQTYLAIVTALGGPLLAIALGYPLGWLACSIFMHIYLRKSQRGRAVYAAA